MGSATSPPPPGSSGETAREERGVAGPGDLRRHARSIRVVADLCVAWVAAIYALEIHGGGHPWKSGDWLIGYDAGFVHRGLFGALLFLVPLHGASMLWLLWLVQVLLWLAVVRIVVRLFLAAPRPTPWLAVLFSPAAAPAFAAIEWEGALRKEILLFLSFGLLLLGPTRERLDRRLAGASLAVFALAALSFDGTPVVVPFFLAALLEATRRGLPARHAAGLAAAYLALAAAALATTIAGGDADVMRRNCVAIELRGLSHRLCTGAIEWYASMPTASDGFTAVRDLLPGYLGYVPLALLAVAPIALTSWARERTAALAVAALAVLPLFAVAIDWGRWIHVYVVLATMLLLAESRERPVRISAVPGWAIALYLLAWNLPPCCLGADGGPTGLVGAVARLLRRALLGD